MPVFSPLGTEDYSFCIFVPVIRMGKILLPCSMHGVESAIRAKKCASLLVQAQPHIRGLPVLLGWTDVLLGCMGTRLVPL